MGAYLRDLLDKIRADLSGVKKSFTIWFNGIMAALVVLVPVAQEYLPQLQEYIPANVYHHLTLALIVGNIILRFKTNGALADK